jgi:hypothetical protein
MRVEDGLFEKGTTGKGKERVMGMNMIGEHYMHI